MGHFTVFAFNLQPVSTGRYTLFAFSLRPVSTGQYTVFSFNLRPVSMGRYTVFAFKMASIVRNLYVTSWDKISRMSQLFHMELNISDFRPHSVLQTREN